MSESSASQQRTHVLRKIYSIVFYIKYTQTHTHHSHYIRISIYLFIYLYIAFILWFTVEHHRKPRYTSNDLTRLVFGAVFSKFGFRLLAVRCVSECLPLVMMLLLPPPFTTTTTTTVIRHARHRYRAPNATAFY